jgi:hypothetical protein
MSHYRYWSGDSIFAAVVVALTVVFVVVVLYGVDRF